MKALAPSTWSFELGLSVPYHQKLSRINTLFKILLKYKDHKQMDKTIIKNFKPNANKVTDMKNDFVFVWSKGNLVKDIPTVQWLAALSYISPQGQTC